MTETTDLIVFWIVVGARFLVPLAIPRFPLPAILAALVIDGVDQTVFQTFTNLNLDGYQGYDKALDIYYLTIAYISTLRNWANHYAYRVNRFLFYWRLVGVALFELIHWRPLLLIFPNTFEYFFIFYETYRLRWDPKTMSRKLVFGAAAFIWIVIKLPQEWWIHIAQLDTTDLIKKDIFGVPVDTPWSDIITSNLGVFVGAIVLVALVLAAAWWYVTRRLPPADRAVAFDADAHQPAFSAAQVQDAIEREASRIVDFALLEKVVMVSLVSIIFAQVLPDVRSTDLQLGVGVALVIIINTTLSHWLSRRGYSWASTLRQFVTMLLINALLTAAYAMFLSSTEGSVSVKTAAFFVLLLTLLVTLYDRYRQVYLMRFPPTASMLES
jgi:hypothetical protein